MQLLQYIFAGTRRCSTTGTWEEFALSDLLAARPTQSFLQFSYLLGFLLFAPCYVSVEISADDCYA